MAAERQLSNLRAVGYLCFCGFLAPVVLCAVALYNYYSNGYGIPTVGEIAALATVTTGALGAAVASWVVARKGPHPAAQNVLAGALLSVGLVAAYFLARYLGVETGCPGPTGGEWAIIAATFALCAVLIAAAVWLVRASGRFRWPWTLLGLLCGAGVGWLAAQLLDYMFTCYAPYPL